MENLTDRVNNLVETCWESFSAKVGGGIIQINKEASLQLNFAYVLRTAADLIIHHLDEKITIELETGILIKRRLRECDIIIKMEKGEQVLRIPIEMKCYKTRTATGSLRGAQDLFRYGIYEDLQLLENYQDETTLSGYQLTMTDYRAFIFPNKKDGKSWGFDTSHQTVINENFSLEIGIGGKLVSILLKNKYTFDWKQVGDFYFLKLKGI